MCYTVLYHTSCGHNTIIHGSKFILTISARSEDVKFTGTKIPGAKADSSPFAKTLKPGYEYPILFDFGPTLNSERQCTDQCLSTPGYKLEITNKCFSCEEGANPIVEIKGDKCWVYEMKCGFPNGMTDRDVEDFLEKLLEKKRKREYWLETFGKRC